MSEPRGPLKAALLVGPLVVTILALHAWGDGAAGLAADRMDDWRYPEQSLPPFQLRAPRRVENADWARVLLSRFPEEAIRNYGALLDLRPPAAPVQVVLLDDTGSRRLGGGQLDRNEGLYDPRRRAIIVRMGEPIELNPVSAELRRGLARLLLHDAGSTRWSPWLAEGLVGLLEGSRASDLKPPAEELPPLELLLGAREAEFRGREAALYARAARLFVAWLNESFPEEFAAYCRASRIDGQPRLARFLERFADPLREHQAWRDWIQAQK